VAIGTDSTDTCKSNYHTKIGITTIIWYTEGYFVALFKVIYILDTREHINMHICIEINWSERCRK
jgi:hypothetical protein